MKLSVLTGWRRHGLAALLGLFSAGMFPPFGITPLLLLYGALYWMVAPQAGAKHGLRTVFATAWWFFLGQFTSGLYWIANALLIPPADFLWLLPLAVVAIPAGLALFPAIILTLWSRIEGRSALGFAVALMLAELARGHLLTGFPWNLAGYAFPHILALQQLASVGGAYLLSFLAILLGVLPAALDRRAMAAWVLLLALPLAWGSWRLEQTVVASTDTMIRIIQPNIPQHQKWDPALQAANFRDHVALSRRPSSKPLAAVIWGETATGYPVEIVEDARRAATAAVPPGGSLITGTIRYLTRDRPPTVTNGMVVLDQDGSLLGAFDKFHLVPFGEYVPGRRWLPLPAVAADGLDFTAGTGPRTLRVPGLPAFAPLICYEVIFPGAVIDEADRPSWLLNLTNDGWYGYSTGPFQHFHITALRAIEEGMPMVRVANTGISGMVDPLGRTLAKIGLSERGILDLDLPKALESPTFYGRYRDLPLALALFAAMAIVACRLYRRHQREEK
ncbi:apolipoprotein N-acyltransferase [Lacibacterium aquatile]|uniref:Apolipoprotein N-acyltransferase n=1 Tax=Lacibacterium aquatile TaxID=1168082 RepID=A0ABW5DM46_9PROT